MSLFPHARALYKQLPGLRKYSTKALNLYEVLGVEKTCPQAQIKVAFYRQAKKMHPDSQGNRDGGEFIRLAAAYEVLRDPDRRATYDAYLSSSSPLLRNAFDFEAKASTQTPPWPEETSSDVAPWVQQYRQAVREVVQYGGDGQGLAHLIKVEFGAAVRKAYFGPELEDLAFGEWPMEFEGEERSVPGLGDIMHLVSGRHLLGTVREAQDILLGSESNAFKRFAIGENERATRPYTISPLRERSGRETPCTREEIEKGVGLRSVLEASQVAGSVADERERASATLNESHRIQHSEGDASNGAKQSEERVEQAERSRTGSRAESSGRHSEKVERSGAEEAPRQSSVRGTEESRAFATLELTQHGEVTAVATREWVPGEESGTDNGMECVDCISIYGVTQWDDSGGLSQESTSDSQHSSGRESSGENSSRSRMKQQLEVSSNEKDGWAEDMERLAMRYGRPKVLARIFGLRDGASMIDVFREGGAKTHTLMQHRTPLVRHVTWYRSDINKRGQRVRKCEARLRRAGLPPSSFWLFEPRSHMHDCGGWYFERFEEKKPRAVSPFVALGHGQPQRAFISDKQSARNSKAHIFATPKTPSHRSGREGEARGGVDMRQHNMHSLKFDWPSADGESVGASDNSETKSRDQQIAKPLDPAVYILLAAYLTLEKEEETLSRKPGAVADLFEKGKRLTGEIRDWWRLVVKRAGA